MRVHGNPVRNHIVLTCLPANEGFLKENCSKLEYHELIGVNPSHLHTATLNDGQEIVGAGNDKDLSLSRLRKNVSHYLQQKEAKLSRFEREEQQARRQF
jgi:hypothetical protein